MFNGGGFGAALTAGLQSFNQAKQREQEQAQVDEQRALQQQALARALARDREQAVERQVERSRQLADTAANSLAENPGQEVGESLRQILHSGGREDMLAPSGSFDTMGDPLMVARTTPQQKATQAFQGIQQKLQQGAVQDMEKKQEYQQVLAQFLRDQPLDFKTREQLATQMGQPLPEPDSGELDRRQDRQFAQQRSLLNARVQGTGQLLKPAQRYGLTSKANADFMRNTKEPVIALTNLEGVNRAWNMLMEAEQTGDPSVRSATEQTIVQMFGKTIDQLSTVRESEFNRAFDLAPLVDRLQQSMRSVVNGGKVPTSVLRGIVELSNEIAKPAQSYITSEKKRIAGALEPYGIGSDELFGDVTRGEGITTPNSVTRGGSGQPGGVVVARGKHQGKPIPLGTVVPGKGTLTGVDANGMPVFTK